MVTNNELQRYTNEVMYSNGGVCTILVIHAKGTVLQWLLVSMKCLDYNKKIVSYLIF